MLENTGYHTNNKNGSLIVHEQIADIAAAPAGRIGPAQKVSAALEQNGDPVQPALDGLATWHNPLRCGPIGELFDDPLL